MKYITLLIVIICWGGNIYAQPNKAISGKVSYVSSQNIYVKFTSTSGINAGDTLFVPQNNKLIAALVVTDLSSTSCVCLPIAKIDFSRMPQIVTKNKTTEPAPQKEVVEKKEITKVKKENLTLPNDTSLSKNLKPGGLKSNIRGSISASSYSYFSNTKSLNSNRYQYNFSLNAKNIAHSKLSAESNISFRHEENKWDIVKANIFQALKIYNLSLNYDITKKTEICFGRRINSKLSSIGAIDGLQFETRFSNFSVGMIAGTRPNYKDYSFDFNLPQIGAYIAHDLKNASGTMQNSFAFVEQMNQMKTDRRFIYYQHNNSLIKDLYLFSTVEIELYKKINDKPENTFMLSSTYTSLSYRLFNKISLSASYDNRKNVIYYETYKNFINQILETESRQGLSFQINYNTMKSLSLGVRSGYRFKNNNSGESRNLYGYISFYNLPGIKTSATLAATYLESYYLKGKIANFNLNRDWFKGKLYTDLGYQFVNYKFNGNETTLNQNIINLSLSWSIIKNLSVSLNYEETLEKQNQYSHLNLQLKKRF